MNDPRIEIRDDHLLVRLDGLDGVAALRRSVVIPFSTIADAECIARPAWPTLASVRVGALVPGRIAIGSFNEGAGERRFVDFSKDTRRALSLRLAGHPEFDQVQLDVEAPEAIVSAVAERRPPEMRMPPVYE